MNEWIYGKQIDSVLSNDLEIAAQFQEQGFTHYIPKEYIARRLHDTARGPLYTFYYSNGTNSRIAPILNGGAHLFWNFMTEHGKLYQKQPVIPFQASSYSGQQQREDVDFEVADLERLQDSIDFSGGLRHLGLYGEIKDETEINGSSVIVFEDLLDSGKSAVKISSHLKEKGARNVGLFYYGHKEGVKGQQEHIDRLRELEISLIPCFSMTNEWIAGCGADSGNETEGFEHQFRDLPQVVSKGQIKYRDFPEIEGYERNQNGIYLPK